MLGRWLEIFMRLTYDEPRVNHMVKPIRLLKVTSTSINPNINSPN